MRVLFILSVLIIILLLTSYWTDLLTSRKTFELIFIISCIIVSLSIIANWFQKPVSKNEEKVRIKRYNWNYFFAWTSIGVLSMLSGLVDYRSENVIFGNLNSSFAVGLFLFLQGISSLITIIIVDKNGVNTATSFMKNIRLKELKSFSLSNTSINFVTDSDEFEYRIFKISDKDKNQITDAITKVIEKYVA